VIYRHLVQHAPDPAGLAGLSPDEYNAPTIRPELQEADIIQTELTGAM